MRELKDKTGFITSIDFIRGEDAYAGMLEGTPYLARKMRLLIMSRILQTPGNYAADIKALSDELANTTRDSDIWPDNERWTAKLVISPEWGMNRRQYVLVSWFQQGGDPIAKLEQIVSNVEIEQYLAYEEYVLD